MKVANVKKVLLIIVIAIAIVGIGFFSIVQLTKPKDPFALNYDPGDSFITDVKSSDSLLKTDVVILVSDDSWIAQLEENNHIIRNDIIFILRSMTRDEIKRDGIEALLSEAIVGKLNAEFETDVFQEIYFNEFVIQ